MLDALDSLATGTGVLETEPTEELSEVCEPERGPPKAPPPLLLRLFVSMFDGALVRPEDIPEASPDKCADEAYVGSRVSWVMGMWEGGCNSRLLTKLLTTD